MKVTKIKTIMIMITILTGNFIFQVYFLKYSSGIFSMTI